MRVMTEATLRLNVELYKSPRLEMVKKYLAANRTERPIHIEDMLPVTLMNYGQVEFEEARNWFEMGENAPGKNSSPSLIDVGAGFGPAGLFFGARKYQVTAIEMQWDIASVGERVITACGLQDNVHYEVVDVMAFEPEKPADTLISVLCLLHIPDKIGAMKKLATLLRGGGRAYLADFYAKRKLSEKELVLLRHEVGCPGLMTRDEYIGALKGAGFKTVRFVDVTAEYSAFVHQRYTRYLKKERAEQYEKLAGFYRAMDTLYRSGEGESSRLGGCRIYLEI
jgi:SAM-dependent methyltransferase